MTGAATTASAFTGGDQGDPMPNSKKNMPSASKGLGGSKSTSGLNTSFRGRLESMMKDNPNVGVSDGYRSSEDQRRLFMSRYSKSTEETDVYWGGTYWKKRGGVADAAPPGMSMHELGLAADLSGDIAWVEKNAGKYGLRTSGGVGEPWHVQPKEVPESRAKYEAMGAPLGRNLKAAPFDKNARFGGSAEHSMRDRTRNASSRASNYAKMGGGVPGRATTVGGGNMIPKFGVVDNTAVAVNTADAFVQKALGQRGHPYKFGEGHDIGNPNEYSFDCSGLVLWAAQQSGYTGLGNTNAQGIYQYAVDHNSTMSVDQALKTKGALLFGKNGDKVSHVAISMGDGTTMEAKSTAAGVDVFPARGGWDAAAMLPGMGASSAPSSSVAPSSGPKGDPMSAPTRGGGSATVYQGGGITISPNIYITSSGSNTMDAKRAAQEIAALLTQDIKKAAMRSL
jgi:cell wall-associated NlpC family hydrolase